MSTLKRSFSASTVYLIYSGASSLFFALVVTVNLIYQLEVAKLSPLQLVLVGTALEVVCFLCQVPTGVLADVYSRRLAVIFGTLIVGVGFVIEGSFPRFETIVLGQALFGIGSTLSDGAEQEAWARIHAQPSVADRLPLVDEVIDNGGSQEETRQQVIAAFARFRSKYPAHLSTNVRQECPSPSRTGY